MAWQLFVAPKDRFKGVSWLSEIFTQWMEVRKLLPLEGAGDGASYLVAIVVVSDVLIALSFYSIFFALVRFMRKRSDVQTWPTAMFSVLA